MHALDHESQAKMTPEEALQRLQQGNQRFRSGRPAKRNLLEQVNETSGGQWPCAAVLSCIDSRVPAELVLDQGVGDIFNIRIAGNFLNDDILGSLEFACCVAGAKLIVVMGHSACGAIKGACDNVELGHLTGMLKKIRPAIDAVDSPREPENRCSANADFVESVARENVRRTVAGIAERSEVLRELRDTGAIEIVGAMYDVSSGSVEFL